MKTYRAELHVHTLLSPCAGIEMIPPLIVDEALQRGIQLLAITDHNSSVNAGAVQKAAEGTGLAVLPGIELQTREEVHTLCLFDEIEQAQVLQQWVDSVLPPTPNNPDFFGEQFVVDETGDFIRREERLLLNSVNASLQEAWRQVNRLGGLFIPAHVNRKAFGLLPVLGLVPDDIPVEVLEISRHISPQEARKQFPQLGSYPIIQSGDVHFLSDFLGALLLTVEAPTIEELRKAIHEQDGRSLCISPG